MIRAILWDNDGVLVDTERLYFEANAVVLRSVGVELRREDYVQLFLIEGRGAWHLVEAAGLGDVTVDELRAKRDAIYVDLLARRARLLDGVQETLRALAGRYVMGVVTTSHRSHFDTTHAATGILHHFDFILAHGDYARSKPYPDPYLAGVARAGVRADECLAIEDSLRGLTSARAAGVQCAVIPTEFTRGCAFEGAVRMLSSVADVLALLRDLDGS